MAKKLPDTVAEAKELLKLYEKIKEAGDAYVDLPEAEEEKLEKLTKFVTANTGAYDALLEKQKKVLLALEEEEKLQNRTLAETEKARKKYKQLYDVKELLNKNAKDGRDVLKKYAKELEGAGKTGTDEYTKLSDALKKTSGDAKIAGIASRDVALAMLGTGKTGIQALKTSWLQYMKTMDDGLVEYTAKTGLYTDALLKVSISALGPYRDVNGELKTTPGLLTKIGLSGKDAGEAFQGMTSHISIMRTRLHDLNYRQQTDLVSNLMMGMKKLGVSYEVSGKNIDIFTRGLKQTPLMALESMKRLDGLADSLKINVNQAIQDFNTLAPTLLAYGDRAIDVFAGMQAQAQATGMAVGDLDKMAAKFDTFEGAATAAGRLNAVLGGTHLSVMELVHADPADKFELIKEAVASAGVAFEDMDRRQKAVIANALNMNIEQASRLFGSQEDFKMAGDAMDTNATEADELTKRINRAMDSTALLKKSWSELAEPIRDYTETLRGVTDKMGEVPVKLMKDLIDSLGGDSSDVEARTRAHEGAIASSLVLMDIATSTIALGKKIPGLGAFTDFGLLSIILGEDPERTKEILEEAAEKAREAKASTDAMWDSTPDPGAMLTKLHPVRDGLNEVALAAKGLSETQPFSFLDDLDDSHVRNMRNVLRQSSAFLRSIEKAPADNIEQAKELFANLAEIPLNVNLLTAAAGGVSGGTPAMPGLDPRLQQDMALANLGPIHVTFKTENRDLAAAVLDGLAPHIRAKLGAV